MVLVIWKRKSSGKFEVGSHRDLSECPQVSAFLSARLHCGEDYRDFGC